MIAHLARNSRIARASLAGLLICASSAWSQETAPAGRENDRPTVVSSPGAQPAQETVTTTNAEGETLTQRPGQPAEVPGGARTGEAAGAQPATTGEASARQPAGDQPVADEDDFFTFGSFAGGVELRTLVEFVAEQLGLNVSIDDSLSGSVMFNAAFKVRRDELLPLLNSLLEQQGFLITRDRPGFYSVRRADAITPNLVTEGTGLGTTRIIRTPNLRPSALQGAVESTLGIQRGQGNRIEYLDDLGVILVTDTPSRVEIVSQLIQALIDERKSLELVRLQLDHLAAPVARDRAIQLVGGTVGSTGVPGQPRQPNQPNQPGGAFQSAIENLSERLSVDGQGNALIFRGRPDEIALVKEVLEVIDRPTTLVPKRYFTGSRTADIASIAAQQGMGEITTLSDQTASNNPQQQALQRQLQQQGLGTEDVNEGGSVIVVDEVRGFIFYYGTPEQQAKLAEFVETFEPEAETVVIREYPLEHSDAEEVGELLRELLLNEVSTANDGNGILPQNQGGAQQSRRTPTQTPSGLAELVGDEAAFTGDPELVNITADIANNQLLVKAPIEQQDQIERILAKIDVRRPQVFVDVKIVSVSNSDDFRLAVETQLINAGGSGGVARTNFGLTTPAAGSSITDLVTVSPNLSGLTTALIFSDQLPFVLNAIETVTDAKIVSNPVLLVDDNEEAELIAVRQEPTTQQSQGDNSTITSFQGFEDAGTSLLITPRISKGGYLRLNYEITLSSFEGSGSQGIPPPRTEQTVRADSVTIPGDATIVVGGITVRDLRKTVVKIPFLGDIPLLGLAFRDTRDIENDSVLYVFITPRILADTNFGGHRLLTEGPRKIAELAPDIPPLSFRDIPIVSSAFGAGDEDAEPVLLIRPELVDDPEGE
ncbi:MAG: secretin N-terminal domain-containing protein [Phycisphaerales bacterium JB037]